jgi:hypothetical protein
MIKVEAEYSRDPDEHEFYQLRVGRGVAELLTACEQASQAVMYLSSMPSSRQRLKGITAHKHILYHLEVHAVRTHSLYDRALQLVDSVFHLLNSATEVSHRVVSENLKVARTDIPKLLKAFRKILAPTIGIRNEVVHRESFKDDALRKLEMYCIVEGFSSLEDEGPLKPARLKARLKELAREQAIERRRELEGINVKLRCAILNLFDALLPIYKLEKSLVARRAQ